MAEHEWYEGDRCRVVEHDPVTMEPKPNGSVVAATVVRAGVYILAALDGGVLWRFYGSGWAANAEMFRWRLLPGDDEAATAAGTENGNG